MGFDIKRTERFVTTDGTAFTVERAATVYEAGFQLSRTLPSSAAVSKETLIPLVNAIAGSPKAIMLMKDLIEYLEPRGVPALSKGDK